MILDSSMGCDSKKKINETNESTIESSENNVKTKLKEKIFIERKSLIQVMYDDTHIRNIHYIFMVFLLTFVVNHIMDGIIHEGRISLKINAITQNFADGHLAIAGWIVIFGATLLVYPVFQLWAFTYNQMGTPILQKSWNILWIAIVLGYYYRIFSWAGEYSNSHNLSFTSAFSITIEATRLLMKTHAFIRSNMAKVFQAGNNFRMPPKFHFLEFLFMPTLVYRDVYPRTNSINWTTVMIYAAELCGCVFFICYLYNLYYADVCAHFKTTPTFQPKDIVWLIFRNTVPSLGCITIMFYFLLHLWQNLWGELTRFADRQFYQDWWNSTSYDEFYRKWNIVVHDWLYNYIYKDTFEFCTSNSLMLPKFVVFLVSAIAHEYILYYTMRMFYPVLSTIFLTLAMILTSFRSPKYWLFNVLFLYGYGFGFSITTTLYITEYCVRLNPCALNSTAYPFETMHSKTFFSDCVN